MSEASREELVEDLVHIAGADWKVPLADIAEHLMYRHRTEQQSVMRLCVAIIEEFAKQTNFDLRNEAAVRFAKEVVKNTDQIHRMMPFI